MCGFAQIPCLRGELEGGRPPPKLPPRPWACRDYTAPLTPLNLPNHTSALCQPTYPRTPLDSYRTPVWAPGCTAGCTAGFGAVQCPCLAGLPGGPIGGAVEVPPGRLSMSCVPGLVPHDQGCELIRSDRGLRCVCDHGSTIPGRFAVFPLVGGASEPAQAPLDSCCMGEHAHRAGQASRRAHGARSGLYCRQQPPGRLATSCPAGALAFA